MQVEKIILGIDPGTSVMGFGIISVEKGKMKLVAIEELVMKKEPNHETKLKRIFDKTLALIDEFHPDEVALEAPFFGKNVQSMLKLGRAQGVAMAAALSRNVPVCEYAPRKIKLAITGKGAASKEQVAAMPLAVEESVASDTPQVSPSDSDVLSAMPKATGVEDTPEPEKNRVGDGNE